VYPLDRPQRLRSFRQETDRRAKFFEEKLRLLPDSLAVHEEWRNLLVTYGVSGVQVHDARLAAALRYSKDPSNHNCVAKHDLPPFCLTRSWRVLAPAAVQNSKSANAIVKQFGTPLIILSVNR
jgi:hypothetical protein